MEGFSYNKRSVLEKYDSAPTANSTNLVPSGGIKTYVDTADATINAKVDDMISRVGNPFVFKGTVAALTDLPGSGNTVNDTYFVTAEGFMYTWNGTSWDKTSTDVNNQLAHDIATEYDATKADYKAGNIVMYNNQVYVRNADATAAEGTFVAANWTATSIGDELYDEVTNLKSAIAQIAENIDFSTVTDGLNNENNGLNFSKISDNTFKIYGTSTAGRRQLLLNGQNAVYFSSSAFSKTLDAGTYKIETSISGYSNVYYFEQTYSTFSNGTYLATSSNPSGISTFSSPVMIGFTFSSGTNYGTSSNPTYVTINITKLSAVDLLARSNINNIESVLNNIESVLNEYGIVDYNWLLSKNTLTDNGITYSYNASTESYDCSGTSGSSISSYTLVGQNPLVDIKPESSLHIIFNSTSSDLSAQLYYYTGETLHLLRSGIIDEWVTLPENTTGILFRVRASNNVTLNASFTVAINGFCTSTELANAITQISQINAQLSQKLGYVSVLVSNDNMNDFGETGAYCYLSGNKPSNAPEADSNGVVIVVHGYSSTGFATQIVSTNSGKFYVRNQFSDGSWTQWADLTLGGGATIENSYNITTYPTITTDTNGWLQSVDTDTQDETGKTDMTGAIMSMLTSTGYCHLGEGIFYVSGNIDMPEGSMLCGCGKNTVIRLLQSTTTGYCVKIGKYCTIKDISFEGARSFTLPSTKGTRSGIAYMANYDATPSVTTEQCMIENIWIKYFSGSGIYCHNTGIRYDKGLYAVNVSIYTCFVGLDIDYYSEFNKFVNVCTSWCKFGCINNSGNNVFTSCTFHATDTGFKIDGTQPNSAHGTLTGCTFCHIGSNTGKALDLSNVGSAGFIIDACQFWYNSINITNSQGVIISNCELGRGTSGAGATILINGGDTIMFIGCMFMNDENYIPDITITDNTKVKFVNCYGSSSGNLITS